MGNRALNPLLVPLWHLAVQLARVGARVAPDSNAKLLRTFRDRRSVLARIRASTPTRDPARPLIWLHAPSVGEGLQARPVLEALRRAHPNWQLAYTWFSPSATTFAQRLDVELRDVLPFDGAAEADALLEAWKPTVLCFVKLDVWPVLAERAAAAGVRTALVSATLASNSGRQGRLARALLGDAYAALDAVGAISPDDAQRLVALGVHANRVHVTGDTRMDQVWQRAQSVGPEHPWRALLQAEREAVTVVAGSTWPADEAVLLPAIAHWFAANPTARLIIAPHEPTERHLEPIARWAASCGIVLTRLSQVEATPDHSWRVLLVDRVGVLGDLYALGDIAYVGGGFHDAGLHSVLEPAAFGIPVLFGPRHRNAREAADLVQLGGAFDVHTSTDLHAQLSRLATDALARTSAGERAQSLVRDGLGSTARVVALLESLVT